MVSKPKDPVIATLSGSIAGMVETAVVWPVENIKTTLQLSKRGTYNGMFDCAKRTVAEKGAMSLYRGMTPVIIGAIPKAGIRFGGFNYIQTQLRLEDGSITPLRNLAAGTCAGAVEALVAVTPIETVKTKLIDGNSGFITGVRNIVAKEGLGGLYAGALATTGKQASNQGLRFMAFGIYSDFIQSGSDTPLTSLQSLVGGMCSGCFSTLCNNPFDMIKSRMQGLRGNEYAGFVDCFQQVVKNEGVLALWSGVIPRLMRVVPGQGVIFMSYNKISVFVAGVTGRELK